MKNKSLERAMENFKNGDGQAFDYIYRNTYKVLFFVVHNIVRDRAAAEDILQDTYLTAFRKAGEYAQNNLLAWLTVSAKNNAINYFNRRKREHLTDFTAESAYIEGDFKMPDEDSFGIIALAENLLSETDFEIVVMCTIAGYKRREVAAIKNMPVSSVTYRLKTALGVLQKNMEKGGAN